MLWIALHLPDLSLQATTRGLLPHIPVAITETSGNRTLVQAANAAARDAGALPGHSAAAARAVDADIVLLPRDVERERDALGKIALSALQFTPGVSVVRDSILLDVESSLMLFGGLGKLCSALRDNLRALGFRATLGVAPTPLAAEMFARAKAREADAQRARACMDPADLEARLRVLPSELLPWDDATKATLGVLGIGSIGRLLDLPRDGVLRRFGFECARDLDRIVGRAPDPREPVVAPETFRTTFDLAAEIDDLALCLNAIERLLAEAEGFLAARGAATATIAVTFHHGRHLTTRQAIGSSVAQRDRQQWLTLVREQLARSPLPAPVTALGLAIDQVCEYVPPPASLPGCAADPRAAAEDRLRLLDRLAARLGNEKVSTIALRDEHRPEEAWTSADAAAGTAKSSTPLRPARPCPARPSAARPRPRSAAAELPSSGARPAPSPAGSALAFARSVRPRPAWLLERPRALIMREQTPLHHGPLTLIAGPERIQSGWWDNKPVDRDYFVARNPLGETCWVYRRQKTEDRDQKTGNRGQRTEEWFLHGIFA